MAPLGWMLSPLVILACKGEFSFLKQIFNRLMFYNYWIGFINETYLFLAVCALLNYQFLSFRSYGDGINSLLSVFFGVVLALFPLFVAVFYNTPRNLTKIIRLNEEFLARYGNAIAGLNFKREKNLVLIHTCVSILRKLWLALAVVLM